MNTTTSSSTERTSHYLLINRNFALLWSGQAISTLGDFIFNTTLVVWIAIVLARGYAWTPVAVSGIFLAATLPTILIGPLVGVFVDRWSKRRTMLVVNILQAIFVAFLLLQLCIASSVHLSLAWQLGIIYLVVFLLNACQQFFGPSVLALIQGIVEEKDQPRAIGLGQISASIATLVGPVLAPPLLLAFGVQWALLFNMLSFVVSFSMLLLVHSSEQDKQERSVGPVHFVTEFIEMDALLQQLRPASLTIADLVEAIRTQCEVLGYRTNARVAVEVHNLPTDELLSPGTIDALFRIVQETLANVARHARAHHVAIRMYGQNDTLDIEIHDDGQGFDTSAASTGMGLANIRERTLALSGSIDIQRNTERYYIIAPYSFVKATCVII